MTAVIPKFPRTLQLPWSPGDTREDRKMDDVSGLLKVPVVVTEKLDGSNVCLTRDEVFARSHSGAPTLPVFDWLKSWHAAHRTRLPEHFSMFCEYLYAVPSIEYEGLPSYLWVIGFRNENLSLWVEWQQVCQLAADLGLPTVPVLGHGTFQRADELNGYTTLLAKRRGFFGEREGIVVRVERGILAHDFEFRTAKWVREGHVKAEHHWMHQPIRKQKLVGGASDAKAKITEGRQGTNLG